MRVQGQLDDFDKTYHDIAVVCFRYLGFKSFNEVDQLTLEEYSTLIRSDGVSE